MGVSGKTKQKLQGNFLVSTTTQITSSKRVMELRLTDKLLESNHKIKSKYFQIRPVSLLIFFVYFLQKTSVQFNTTYLI